MFPNPNNLVAMTQHETTTDFLPHATGAKNFQHFPKLVRLARPTPKVASCLLHRLHTHTAAPKRSKS
jgi:hypothetical protein